MFEKNNDLGDVWSASEFNKVTSTLHFSFIYCIAGMLSYTNIPLVPIINVLRLQEGLLYDKYFVIAYK